MRKIIILFSVALFLLSCNRQPIDLSLNLEKGKEYLLKMNLKEITTLDYGGYKINFEFYIFSAMSFKVKDITDTSYIFDIKYDTLSFTVITPQQKISYDSGEKVKDIYSRYLKAIIDKSFQLEMTKKGKVVEIKNLDNIFTSALEAFPELDESKKLQLIKFYKQTFGEENLKANFEASFRNFPNHKVKIGDTWTVKTKISYIPGEIVNEYKLKRQTANEYIIVSRSTIKTDEDKISYTLLGYATKYELQGIIESEFKIDKRTGWVKDGTVTEKMEGFVHIRQDTSSEWLKIPFTLEINGRFEGSDY